MRKNVLKKKGKKGLSTGPRTTSLNASVLRGLSTLAGYFKVEHKCRIAKYPKTSLAKPGESDPAGPRSVAASFQWPKMFLSRLIAKFGKAHVHQRFHNWRWAVTTAFSGVGCPETAHDLVS